MRLTSGTPLGPYRITSFLGAGAMGEVYRATDPRIGRDVAVKVLPPSFAEDADRMRRFEQEAHAAGILNHQNLLTIFDLGRHEDSPYIVCELLEGMTLRDRMEEEKRAQNAFRDTRRTGEAKAGLALWEALDYGVQIASGLAAAHSKGIIHRDLKPENLFLTHDHRLKILDFGLAKVTTPVRNGDTPNIGSEPGTLLGTPGYMAPEQIKGQTVDQRSDIFSLGAIIFEMLTGRKAFEGDSVVETLMAILREQPPTEELRPISPAVERLVQRCLQRDPGARFQSAQDLSFAIDAVAYKSDAGLRPASGPSPAGSPIPGFRRITFRRGYVMSARFAPDGSIVYGATWEGNPLEIFVSHTGNPESRPLGLPGADILSIYPTGEMAVALNRQFVLGYATTGTLARVPLSGGAPREIYEDIQDGEWGPDGKSFMIVRRMVEHCRLEYPVGNVIYETAGWVSRPRFSHDGQHIAFVDHPLWGDDGGSIMIMDVDGGNRVSSRFWTSTSGVAWHPGTREVWMAADPDGISRDLYAMDRNGSVRALYKIPGRFTLHDISRDGKVLVTYDSARRELMLIETAGGKERNLSWFDWCFPGDISADGSKVLFEEQLATGTGIPSIYVRRTDGSPAVLIGEGRARALSPDGKWALSVAPNSHEELILLPTGAGEPRTIRSEGLESMQWWAFHPTEDSFVIWANEKDHTFRLYRQRFDEQRATPISPEGVRFPLVISPDGAEVVAIGPDQLPARYCLDGTGGSRLLGGKAGEWPLQWSSDGKTIYVFGRKGATVTITAIDAETGTREHWRDIRPTDSAGVLDIGPMNATRDLEMIVYSYRRILSDLFVLEGLH